LVVRVKGSAGPVKGELEVTSSGSQAAPVSTAIAILVLVTAATLPAVTTGLDACGAFAVIFGAGAYITYRRPG
jgi:hypothetical protein